jgi:hypothetical protein
LAIAGIYVALRGIPGTGGAIGVGSIGHAIKNAPPGENPLETAILVADKPALAGKIAFVPFAAGTGLIIKSVQDERKNGSVLNSALQDCAKRFPGANTSLSFLNF